MSLTQPHQKLSPKEYLEGEILSDIKHELIDGDVYSMAGTSANHERISLNISSTLIFHLKSSSCEPFGSDMKVKTNNNFYYPDVIVDCNFDESTPYYTDSPKLIVEVLSKSTRRIDQTTKRSDYLSIPTLEEYILIEQDIVDIEVVRRTEGWQSKHYYLGDELTLESIGLTLSVEDIYHRVKNEDVIEYLAKKELDQTNESKQLKGTSPH
jgi:Uma2 family endonuclease